jgi:hypothetical protein
VVSRRLADVLVDLQPKIEIVPVRLEDPAGKTVSTDYVVAAPKRVVQCMESDGGDSFGGYLFGVRNPPEPKDKLPPVFRSAYTLAICCNGAAAERLAGFSGMNLVPFPEYVDSLIPSPAPAYEILRCGTEGAELSVDSGKVCESLEKGESLLASWPESGRVAKMIGQKSRKKIVDFTDAGGAPLITAKARAILEPFGLDGVELLPAKVKDHAGKVVKGDHWLMHVVATRPYVDVAESDIERVHGLLWTAREIVVDERAVADRPAFFRVPGARYPWVFVRADVAAAMTAAKLTGFRTEAIAEYAHVVEGGGIPHIC